MTNEVDVSDILTPEMMKWAKAYGWSVGMRHATEVFVARIDADDMSLLDLIEKLKSVLADIPKEFRGKEFLSYPDLDESNYLPYLMEVKYRRPETDDEVRRRAMNAAQLYRLDKQRR